MRHITIQDLVNKAVKIEKLAIALELEAICGDNIPTEDKVSQVACLVDELKKEAIR